MIILKKRVSEKTLREASNSLSPEMNKGLKDFRDAARHITQAWEKDGNDRGPKAPGLPEFKYPRSLPSFDEFVMEVEEWTRANGVS